MVSRMLSSLKSTKSITFRVVSSVIFSTLLLGLCPSVNALAAEKILILPYSKQFQAFTCGHESLRMVLGYWGRKESRERILLQLGANGSNADRVEDVVKANYPEFKFAKVNLGWESIREQINAGRPIMLGADASGLSYLDYDSSSGHMIVVVGYNEERKVVFIRDPNSAYYEELTHDALLNAALDDGSNAFVIYNPSVSNPAPQPDAFDKAFPPHTPKKQKSGIPLNWLLPTFYLSYETIPKPNLSESFKASSKSTSRFYVISWNGLSTGHQTMELTPWLGNGKIYKTHSVGTSYRLGGGLKLGPTELMSPGVYDFGRHRTLDVHNFTSIKRVPSLNLGRVTLEATGYLKPKNDETLTYDELGLEAFLWSGGRLGVRRGLSPRLGHLSAGITAGKVMYRFVEDLDKEFSAPTFNYDVNLGILKGSYQSAELTHSDGISSNLHDGVKVQAFSLGLDYNLGSISSNLNLINAMNYIGIFRPHLELTHEIVKRTNETSSRSTVSRKWELELPVPLHFADLVYGASLKQTWFDNNTTNDVHAAWFRFAFNAYQPWVQLTTGYRVLWTPSQKLKSQQISLGMFAGL